MNSKNKTQGSALFTLVSGIVIVVAVVVLLIKLASSGSYADVDATTKEATETRIMPTGQLVVGAPKDIAPAPAATPAASSDASAPASDAAGASALAARKFLIKPAKPATAQLRLSPARPK